MLNDKQNGTAVIADQLDRKNVNIASTKKMQLKVTACSKMADGGLRQFISYLINLVLGDNGSASNPISAQIFKASNCLKTHLSFPHTN